MWIQETDTSHINWEPLVVVILSAQQTCSQAMHARLLTCHEAYNRGFRCCPRCDPCGFDGNLCSAPAAAVGSSSWVSPRCVCDKVIVTGACSLRGCAKPDVLGVFSRRPGWRTSDGRHVYVKDRVQPIQGLHSDAHHHQSYDDTSGSSSSNSTKRTQKPSSSKSNS